jgi:hypothetical protein
MTRRVVTLSKMTLNGSLRTDDLALAVTLILDGATYELARGVKEREGAMRPTCFWVFPTDERTSRTYDEYKAGRALVDPNKFVRTWGVVRREMIDFLQ